MTTEAVTLALVARELGMRRLDLEFMLITRGVPYDSTRQLVPIRVAARLLANVITPTARAVQRAALENEAGQ